MSYSAPGKIILLGEHAVVYGQPAIAIPVPSVRTEVTLSPHRSGILITSPSLGLNTDLRSLEPDHPINQMFQVIFSMLEIDPQGIKVDIRSTIPVASGLGSGAALSAACVKAFAAKYEKALPLDRLNEICFATEKIFHGNPSGVDNTVITHAMPVYYKPKVATQPLNVAGDFHFLIANTGVQASTKEVVAAVRKLVEKDPTMFSMIERVGEIVEQGKIAIAQGNNTALGDLMNANHSTLQALTVSNQPLDQLVSAARLGGAYGAKLSGAGRGGNMIALVPMERALIIKEMLFYAGAKNVLLTLLSSVSDRVA